MAFTITSRQVKNHYYDESIAEGILPIRMMLVPAGSFMMGSPEAELERKSWEGPQHEVTVSQFFMSKYPVTQAQWRAVTAMPPVNRALKSDPSDSKGNLRPVGQVSWHDAVEFCDRLTIATKRQYRLPTESEWEYACRAETTTPFHFGETLSTDYVNCKVTNEDYGVYALDSKGVSRRTTNTVGTFDGANTYGLCDMHGNVWEWCQDHWHESYEGAPTDGRTWFTYKEGSARILRGGSWRSRPTDCRSACRFNFHPDTRNSTLGFRVSCSVPVPQNRQELESIDTLARLANPQNFDKYLEDKWPSLVESKQPISVIRCDIDHFQLYKDAFGLDAGERCVIRVARAVINGPQELTNLVARYGDDEFAIVLPHTDTHGAWSVAEKIHDSLRALKIVHVPSQTEEYVTVTIGIASVIPVDNTTTQTLVEAADRALQYAKQQGRNRTCVSALSQTQLELEFADTLNCLANRKDFVEYLEEEWPNLIESKQPISVIRCDIDHFQLYKDNFGLEAGEHCLIRVARAVLNGPESSTDLVARYGDDEFAIVLPYTGTRDAWRIAKKIHDSLRALKITHVSSPTEEYVTVTIGIASIIPADETTTQRLVEAADKALQYAKQQGRNCTYVNAHYNTVGPDTILDM